jgi:heme/copper-type cytochrome/quinol oxidase subunit 1
MDRQLLSGMFLCITAAGVEVIVGYCVAHWITLTASKTVGYIVSSIALLLCMIAGILALNVRSQLAHTDDTQPRQGRRLFMANLNLLVAMQVITLIFAATVAVGTVRPNS